MIKIISNWSAPGGSTQSFINLTNALNERGYETCFYGKHDWHLNKCNGKMQKEFSYYPNDRIISHFILHKNRIKCKKFILSSHETYSLALKDINYKIYDIIHYVSEWQKNWHNLDYKYFILPNIHESTLKKSEKKPNFKVGGIIASLDPYKNIEISIEKAIEDKCKYIYIFGAGTDKKYWYEKLKPFIEEKNKNGNEILYVGYKDDKQQIYDCLTDVYNYSTSETWGYVEGECKITGTNYHSDLKSNYYYMNTDDIIKKWVEVLEL